MSCPPVLNSRPTTAPYPRLNFRYIRNSLNRMQRAITDWLIAGPRIDTASTSGNHQDSSVRQPLAVGTFMSSIRSTRPATGQLRRDQNVAAEAEPTPRRSRRVAGEAPESGPYSPTRRRQSRQVQSHPPPPQSDFTFTHNDPPVPHPGFFPLQNMLRVPTHQHPAQISMEQANPLLRPFTNHPYLQVRNPSVILPTVSDSLTYPINAFDRPVDQHPNMTSQTGPTERKTDIQPKMCVICCDAHDSDEEDIKLVQPCRSCNSFYCSECMRDMFLNATQDTSLMPPKCCTMLSITSALPFLTTAQADGFRAKFEEWLTPHKTYCPVSKCSKFIPDRYVLRPPKKPATLWGVLRKELPRILENLQESNHSRFIRSPSSPTKECITDFFKRVHRPVFLDTIMKKMPNYNSLTDFIADFDAMISCTQRYSSDHKVATSGTSLRKQLEDELNKISSESFAGIAKLPSNACFACPDCHIGICADCKQMVHPGKSCDTTSKDEEMAMLETFGYKKCPKCGHGVKRMFGCRHMQCRCGSHWCWSCLHSIDECDGGCTSYDGESEDEYNSEDEETDDEPVLGPQNQVIGAENRPSQVPQAVVPESQTQASGTGNHPSQVTQVTQVTQATQATVPQTAATPNQRKPTFTPPVNLDAGGSRIWAGSGTNFGDEPGEEIQDMMWSCAHEFDRLHLGSGATRRGMSPDVECLWCFGKMKALPHPVVKLEEGYKSQDGPKDDEEKSPAWQCIGCEIILCTKCRDKAELEI